MGPSAQFRHTTLEQHVKRYPIASLDTLKQRDRSLWRKRFRISARRLQCRTVRLCYMIVILTTNLKRDVLGPLGRAANGGSASIGGNESAMVSVSN